MLRGTLLSNLPLLATLFANRPVDERSEVVVNPISSTQLILLDVHCLELQ
jgi:hypothetical protein